MTDAVTNSPITSVPLPQAEQISAKISLLQQQLQQQSPGYESLLHELHVALHADEEMVHLLTEEQVGIICAGLAKKKGIVIAAVEKKGSTSSGKKLKEVTLGVDL